VANKGVLLALLHPHVPNSQISAISRAIADKEDLSSEYLVSMVKPRVSAEAFARISQTLSNQSSEKAMMQRLEEEEISIVTCQDSMYPPSLAAISNSPPLLYVKGNPELLLNSGIGICGSRDASPKGLDFAYRFGATLASLGLAEISGYAKGVDTKAHLGALKSDGSTIVVLAEGIFNFRLKEAFQSISGVRERMTVISEFPPSLRWYVSNAMRRNRTICGLSQALVVVEANSRGGTIAAGRECLKQHKRLLVAQYSSQNEMPIGNSELIAEGATPIHSIREMKSHITQILKENRPVQNLLPI